MHKAFTLPLALTPKETLLIGAGSVAKQKHIVLKESQWEVKIVAKEIKDSYFNPFAVEISEVSDSYLKDFEIIIDASGDEALGAYLWKKRKHFGYLLNVVDNPKFCDFYFGAIARYEDLSVLVSTNGASPILAQSIRDKIVRILPKTLVPLVEKLKKMRQNEKLDSTKKELIKKQCKESLGKVFIIGCGPNSLQSLTLKALETFELLDVALLDNLIGKEIWNLLENLGIPCISVGKQKGRQSFPQEEINALMLKLAKEGKNVGRLKGGDPVIFGRVFEEGSFLKSHDIEVELISGLSSSLNGALMSGITPTLRGVSAGVLIVSAHLRENTFHTEWLHFLKNSPYTLIVMMAYSFAKRIVQNAKELEIPLSLPAAFISKVDSKEQKIIIGTLGQLEQMAQMCDKPAILIIGKAINECLCMPFIGQRIII
ncbi:uroporphyrinogen-III C-methyltransferase [Helicobacter sp. Faydin-H64]|uniref:precorrin-2 dehydrogenase n=2 Tax=Helicobacter turcicus TaxID=2867412 RepID=A0ABS7JQ42_9HELI|nr:uroporphyrinogen-III C-methyltransferase [Helicobacter turcicus]MBX7546382.1 uroporphyrinogen-III C-methyltransferase [Helicobacter turcicus]